MIVAIQKIHSNSNYDKRSKNFIKTFTPCMDFPCMVFSFDNILRVEYREDKDLK